MEIARHCWTGRLIIGMSRQWNQNRRRSAGDPPLAEPSSRPSHLIPLDILQQSFVQNSSAASSNLSSSQSPSATPPSSAEQLPQQENWPCVANSNATRPASPAPQPSQPPQPPPSTDPHTVAADADTPSHSAEHGGNGNQATQAPHQQDSSDAWGISLRGMGRWASARGWFQSTLGITSLVVTMVSLFLYGIRSYQMARWSERNDLMQMCASLIQVIPTFAWRYAHAHQCLGQRQWRSRLWAGPQRGPNITTILQKSCTL